MEKASPVASPCDQQESRKHRPENNAPPRVQAEPEPRDFVLSLASQYPDLAKQLATR